MSGWIPPNHSCALPGACVVVDTETIRQPDPERTGCELHTLKFGIAKYWRQEAGRRTREKRIEFKSDHSFWSWLAGQLDAHRMTWVFAHNISFDLSVLKFWERLDAGQYTLGPIVKRWQCPKTDEMKESRWDGFIVDNDPPVIIHVKHQSGNSVVFVDTFNYWRCSLERIGESMGYPKLPMPDDDAGEHQWRVYCERDVDILVEALCGLFAWCRKHDLGRFRYTIASQAFGAWRHDTDHAMVNTERPAQVKQLERRAYYGGRCELLFVGNVDFPIWELDVASMYPSVMRGNPFPRLYHNSWLDGGPYLDCMGDPGLTTTAEVLVETDSDPYPIRTREGVFWCRGRFWTSLCGPELERAFDSGHVIDVAQWATFRLGRLFDGFVDKFWNLRSEHEEAGEGLQADLCKDLLTSLYGKWGQQTPVWERCDDITTNRRWGIEKHRRPDTGEEMHIKMIAGVPFVEVDRQDHKHSLVAVAAWTTAYARERMRELVHIAGPGHVYYVVADALYVDMFGKGKLESAGEVQPNTLGKLRVKAQGDDATFSAVHNYRVGTKNVVGALKHDAKQLSETEYMERVFEGLSGVIAHGPRGGVQVTSRIKSIKPRPKRVIVGDDGWTTPVTVHADTLHDLWRMRDRYNPPSFGELGTWIRNRNDG